MDPMDLTGSRRVLAIRFEALGDLVLLTPVLAALADRYRQPVEVLVSRRYEGVFAGLPFVGRCLGFDDGCSLVDFTRFARALAREQYDLVIDFHSSLRSWRRTLLTLLAKGCCKVGYRKRGSRILFDATVQQRKYSQAKPRHYIHSYADLVAVAGVEVKSPRLMLSVSSSERRRAVEFLRGRGVEDSAVVVALYPGARLAFKRWPPERFAEVGDRLSRELGARILIMGGIDDGEIVRTVRDNMRTEPIVAAVDDDLRLLAALIERCRLMISNDTGPKHVAAALRTPVIALHGPSDPRIWGPIGDEYRVLTSTGLECRPCNDLVGCSRGDSACLREISVGAVCRAAHRELALVPGQGIQAMGRGA